jgi:CRP-like cAMP-binding protein
MELVLVVARNRPDVFESLSRQCAELEGVRVVLDRRESAAAPSPTPERRLRSITLDLEALGFAIVPAGRPAVPRAGSAAPATVAVLRMLEVFRAFSVAEIEALASQMTWRALQTGQMLFREGEVGNEMYFVLSGRLLISKTVARNVDKVLTRMGPGDFFGEMNLFGGLQRSASVQAETDTELLVLDRNTLTAVVEHNPQAGLAFFTALVREFSQRLSATDDLVGEVTRWGLEASGFDLSEDRRPTKMAAEPTLDPSSESSGDRSLESQGNTG